MMDMITRKIHILKNPALFFDTRREKAVMQKLPEEAPSEINRLRREIDSLKNDCGCKVGSIVLFIGMLLYFLFLFTAPDVPGKFTSKLYLGIIVFFSSAVFGKILGLLRARILYSRSLKKLSLLADNINQ